jgi:dTDP-4-dehydrorhamnose reductase
MRCLVLGASGMLGHKLVQILSSRFETWSTIRRAGSIPPSLGFEPNLQLSGVDVRSWRTVADALNTVQPNVVVNAVGIVKQLQVSKEAIPSIEVNSLFPHRLAAWCEEHKTRLVHISTDCVFSGRGGAYVESDPSDALDLYGRTKYLGEVTAPGCLTIRTSIVGRELQSTIGILEWFLSQNHISVHGFANSIFSGLPTITLSEIIADLIESHPKLSGLYHVASEPISKLDLLRNLKASFDTEIEILPVDEPRLDRSLDASAFRKQTGFEPPSWAVLAKVLAADTTPYRELRTS